IIANVAGATLDDYRNIAERLDSTDVDMIELNISCPNVKQGGATWGTSCEGASTVTKAVRAATKKPIMVKLTPNVTNVVEIAKAVEAEGADCLSLINTLLGMRIDIRTKRPILHNNVGGFSGPAIFPVAVRMVWQVASAVNIDVVGMGGVSTAEDAIEMMMAGAKAVQMGTAIFTDPYSPLKVIDGIEKYMIDNNIENLSEITGSVNPW
ncbi:MAG: dihydroorotate dehydrogenase, partial [Oscillospiraceae bacterium]|nr:dihydroorotate dehydrogenase [Oscillospiraceae bacterium]